MNRSSYHTSLKELVHHNLIPETFVAKIPKSNLYRWKNDNFSRYVGSEINQIADKHLDLIQTLNHYPKMFQAYGKLVNTMVNISAKTKDFSRIIRESKKQVVNAINNVKGIISIEKAAQVFNISKGTFHAWVIDTKYKCDGSFFKQCLKSYPFQITPVEVKQIKSALTNPKTLHWSMKSVYFNGIRNNSLSISLKTLYKVNGLLGIRKTKGKGKKKKRKKKGIRASIPNQIWHTDITVVKTLDGKRHYVYILMDNFSRKILAYDIQERVMGRITSKLIEQAYQKASKINKNLNVKLIVDGGPENNNIHVDNFINQSQINIQKLVALRDIDFSNSMIERVNMTLKYRYLFPKEIRDLKHLKRVFRYFLNDYNYKKPHGQLNGLTPDESWRGIQIDKSMQYKALKQARTRRIAFNKENKCTNCK